MPELQFVPITPSQASGNPREVLAGRLNTPQIIESKDLLRPTPPDRMMAAVLGPENVPHGGDPAEIRAHLSTQEAQELNRAEWREKLAISRQKAFFQVAQPPNGYAQVELYAGSPAHIPASPQVVAVRLQELFGQNGHIRFMPDEMDRAELIVRVIRDCPQGSEDLRQLAIQRVNPHVMRLSPPLRKAVAEQLRPEANARKSEALKLACQAWTPVATDSAEGIIRTIRDCLGKSEISQRETIQSMDPHVRRLSPALCKKVVEQLLPEVTARQSKALGLACLDWLEHCEQEDAPMFSKFTDNLDKAFGGSIDVFKRLVTMTKFLPSDDEEAGRVRLASLASRITDYPAAAAELLREIGDDPSHIQEDILKHLAYAGVTRLQHADPNMRIAREAWTPILTDIWDQAGRLDEPYRTEMYRYLSPQ
jgi:hypothetical protein